MNVTVSVDLYMYNKIFFKKNKLKTQTLKFYCLNYTMKCLKGHAAFLQFFSNIHAKYLKSMDISKIILSPTQLEILKFNCISGCGISLVIWLKWIIREHFVMNDIGTYMYLLLGVKVVLGITTMPSLWLWSIISSICLK